MCNRKIEISYSSYCFSKRKRFIDIVLATNLLLVVVLFIPIVWLTNKLSSNQKMFFLQSRIGLQQEEFVAIKFLSMWHVGESEKSDSYVEYRFTMLGKFLRMCHIDEFPQAINVLKGEMSVVGPRPYIETECKKLSSELNGFENRHVIKPGITGLAQVYYDHSNDPSESGMNKLSKDLQYVKESSMGLDIKILFKTVGDILLRRGM